MNLVCFRQVVDKMNKFARIDGAEILITYDRLN